MNLLELQEEGMFQKRLDANLCIKCCMPLKKVSESERKCEICKLTIRD